MKIEKKGVICHDEESRNKITEFLKLSKPAVFIIFPDGKIQNGVQYYFDIFREEYKCDDQVFPTGQWLIQLREIAEHCPERIPVS
ncbi:hypothetical protein JXA32_06995 [Candidatus Sumerlaeota bacterium]|nr:hypothetical protein [Candidatus Sumerlaeota bacterium]